MVGGVVHDVVRQDHRGEDGVAPNEASAESVGGSRRVGRLHKQRNARDRKHVAALQRWHQSTSIKLVPCHVAALLIRLDKWEALHQAAEQLRSHRMHAGEEGLHLGRGVKARLVVKLGRLLFLWRPHFFLWATKRGNRHQRHTTQDSTHCSFPRKLRAHTLRTAQGTITAPVK